MPHRYVLLALFLIGGVLVTHPAWAAVPTEIQIFQAHCHQGNAEGCLQLGIRYDFGLGVIQDYVQAVVRYHQACDGGSAGGCFLLGAMYDQGQGVKQSDTDALTYYGKACDLNNKDGCEFYAKRKQQNK